MEVIGFWLAVLGITAAAVAAMAWQWGKRKRKDPQAPSGGTTGPSEPGLADRPGAAEICHRLKRLEDKLEWQLTRTELVPVLKTIQEELGALSGEVRRLRGDVAHFREELSRRGTAAPELLQATSRSVPTMVERDQPPPWGPVEGPAEPPRPGPPSIPVEEVILARFDEIDRGTNRDFARLKSEFEQLLRGRIVSIEERDNAVLFHQPGGTVIVYPWKNSRLGRTWFPYFELDRGANMPIVKIQRPAILKPIADGGWIVIQRGYGRNDS